MGCTASKVAATTTSHACATRNNTCNNGRANGISNACDRSAELFLKDFFDAQMSGALPMTLDFDKAEFSRKVDQNFINCYQINPDDEAEVVGAIKSDPMLANMGSGSAFMIAAQFKNSKMKTSSLSPQEIEAILTKICDEKCLGWPAIDTCISYSDDFFMFERGVRSFCFSGRRQ